MFWQKKKPASTPATEPGTLLDPSSRLPLPQKPTPGYYPGYRVLDQQKFWDAATRKLINERITASPQIRFFKPSEAATMRAVVDRVLPQDDRTEATRIDLLAGVDKRLHLNHLEGYRYEDMPPDQEAYRIAAHAVDAMAQELHHAPFADLKTIHQEEILQSLHDNEPLAAKDLWQPLNLKRFWSMLVADCCAVYYAHPSAWDEVGFGGPAYPRGYMRLEDGEAEPWEVNEQRYEWLAPIDTISDREQKMDEEQGKGGTH